MLGKDVQFARPEEEDAVISGKLWLWFAVCSSVALVVPFCSGWVAYHYNVTESLHVRPWALLGILAAAAGINLLRCRGKWPWSVVCLGLLIVLRLLDAVVLNRVDSPSVDPVSLGVSSLIFLFAVSYFAMDSGNARAAAFICAILTVIICTASNAVQWFAPEYIPLTGGRPGGWLVNPNSSAMTISLMMGVSLINSRKAGVAIFAIVVAGLGIFITFSRGGVVLWLAMVLCYSLFRLRSKKGLIIGFALLVVAFGLAFAVFHLLQAGGENKDVAKRLEMFRGHTMGDLDDTDRISVLMEALDGVEQQPLVGYGTLACSTMFHPHNMWVGAWIDSGVAGLVLFAIAFVLLFYEVKGAHKETTVLFIGLLLSTLFTHNLLTDQSFFFCWAVCAGGGNAQKNTD